MKNPSPSEMMRRCCQEHNATREECMAALDANERGISFMTPRQRDLVRSLTPPQVRPCGDCTLCCTAPSIEASVILEGEDFQPKPAGTACSSCMTKGGCSRYNNRPEICKGYMCLWSLGMVPAKHYPMFTGVCWTLQPSKTEGEIIVIGHTHDCDKALADPRNQEAVMNLLNTGKFSGVTLRSHKNVVSFPRGGGSAAVADIDQTDPLLTKMDLSTVRESIYSAT